MFNLSSVSLYMHPARLRLPSDAAQFAETIRTTGRRMSREVPALTTTYRLQRGSVHDCHWQLQCSLWWKTSVTWQRFAAPLLSCFLSWFKQGSRCSSNTHAGFCRAGLFWKSWMYFFCEVVKHELKMRLEFCYHIVVLALNNKKLDLQTPFTSHPTAFYISSASFYAMFILSNTPTTLRG